MRSLWTRLCAGWMLGLGLALADPALADPAVWALLQRGGQVVLMRHAETDPGVGDPDGMVLMDCRTQRNLSAAGRAQAARAGEAFRQRGVPVGELLSSPWCRCIETARLAFGRVPETSAALGNLYGRRDPGGRQVAQMKKLVTGAVGAGNRVLVSHGSTISALTGVYLGPAELLVVTPRADGFTVAGRLSLAGQ